MNKPDNPIRVLYSYPLKIGATRICHTAWQQVTGLAGAGADVTVFPGVLHRPFAANVKVRPTLSRGKLRIPYKAFGKFRAFALHDWIVARRLRAMADQVDIVHTWPMGALLTLQAARELGIPSVLERPNAHTRFAYEVVRKECERLGVALPDTHEHSFNAEVLAKEEAEYQLADHLLCPSDFVARTFLDQGFTAERLACHQYGFDAKEYCYNPEARPKGRGLSMLFVGGCAPRKGLHFALEAWLQSAAHHDGVFQIAGEFVRSYADKLAPLLSHPSVRVLGHRNDVADLMRASDVLVLPTIEEGSALVTSEARGCGCVLLVSEAAGAICRHMENALVHSVADVKTLTAQITLLHEDRALLERLRVESLRTVDQITWEAAGIRLLEVYREILDSREAHHLLDARLTVPANTHSSVGPMRMSVMGRAKS